MHGDFSRWTFERAAGYRAVLLQQGRVLLDADFNEQTAITAHHDEVRTRDAVGRTGAPAAGAGFAIVDAAGAAPALTAWEDLRIAPGRFYVDGVLAEAEPVEGGGHALADQPHLRVTPDLPGLPEPEEDGRYAVVLDVWTHHVTADEAPRLLESALGGPDTATRAQTVWQLRLHRVGAGVTCAEARDSAFLTREPPTMTASLDDVAAGADPCEITTANGYRRLENQLYRVEIHEIDPGTGAARYKWSRENGSVVAGLTAIAPTAVMGMDAELTLDREGRDEELAIGEGDLVEVTSTDRALHGIPGHLATAGAPVGLLLPVAWSGAAPGGLDALGRAPVVRRWDGGPRVADAAEDQLEDGIQVAFGGGEPRTGDHWLIPARTVRLVYGATALSGTIEWPVDDTGASLPQPPLGPEVHRTTIALLERTSAAAQVGWTLRADCRRVFPPLTELVTIDLLGGDGQEADAGQPLPEVVRVAVRNGGLPVAGAPVRFSAPGGHVDAAPPTAADPAGAEVLTDARGHAEIRWLLDATGPETQVLTATLLDDGADPVGAEVRVTGRLRSDPAAFAGMHVSGVVSLRDQDEIGNDTVIPPRRLSGGIAVVLDGAVDPQWVKEKPVLRVGLDLPWPVDEAQRAVWGDLVAGTQRIDLRGIVSSEDRLVRWEPVEDTVKFLAGVVSIAEKFEMERVPVHVTLLGNVVAGERDGPYVNGRAFGKLRPDGTTALILPSVDDVHGADFTMWFWLARESEDPPRIIVRPERLTFGAGPQTQALSVINDGRSPLLVDADARTISPPATRIYEVRPRSHEVPPGSTAEFAVTSLRGAPQPRHIGELELSTNDPQRPTVIVPLASPGLGDFGIVPIRTGVLRLAPVRTALVAVAGPEAATGAPGTRPLGRAVAERPDHPKLRLAVAPGFEAAVDELRERMAAVGSEVGIEVVDGDPAELVARAAAGDLVLDGVLGDDAVAIALAGDAERAILPLLEL